MCTIRNGERKIYIKKFGRADHTLITQVIGHFITLLLFRPNRHVAMYVPYLFLTVPSVGLQNVILVIITYFYRISSLPSMFAKISFMVSTLQQTNLTNIVISINLSNLTVTYYSFTVCWTGT